MLVTLSGLIEMLIFAIETNHYAYPFKVQPFVVNKGFALNELCKASLNAGAAILSEPGEAGRICIQAFVMTRLHLRILYIQFALCNLRLLSVPFYEYISHIHVCKYTRVCVVCVNICRLCDGQARHYAALFTHLMPTRIAEKIYSLMVKRLYNN